MAALFEKTVKGGAEEKELAVQIDGGNEQSLDFYQGAETAVNDTLFFLHALGVKPDPQLVKHLSMKLGYISYKIVSAKKMKEKTNRDVSFYIY